MAPKRKRAVRNKAKKREAVDYLSSLPDDILVSILTHLSIKEAVATSVLSRQWEHLSSSLRRLEFDDSPTLDRIAAQPSIKSSERQKFIDWVNHVVRQHRGLTLDVFRISFDLDNTCKSAIDDWIKFVISKCVQYLQLDLLEYGQGYRDSRNNYTTLNAGISRGLKFLKVLALKCVNVNDEALHSFMCNSPKLQYISIHGSGELRNVRVTGFSNALVYINLVFCPGIESIEISNAISLTSFHYVGPVVALTMTNVPMLKEVSVGLGYPAGVLATNIFAELACCLGQLHVLTLDIYHPNEDVAVYNFPGSPNLKELVLKIGAWGDDCLLGFTSMIRGCPKLCRFTMQLIWMKPTRRRRNLREASGFPHESLKMVEIVGYYGRISEVEIVMYCIQNCISLEKIIIDPRYQIVERAPMKRATIKKEEAARESARKQLEDRIPPGVQLIIL